MNAERTHAAPDDVVRCDLDLLAGHRLEHVDEPRIAPYLEHPMTMRERRCPACGRHYGRRVDTCPHDGHPTDRVVVARPFLWLG